MKRSPLPASALLFGLLSALLPLGATGCDTPLAKFAACEADSDCRAPDGGKLVCYSRRCVECQYDHHCLDGRLCGGNNTCESFDTRTPPEADAPPPKTLEECAKRCQGEPVCGQACRDRFSAPPPPR